MVGQNLFETYSTPPLYNHFTVRNPKNLASLCVIAIILLDSRKSDKGCYNIFFRMFHHTQHLYFLFAIGCVSAAPADEPVRVDLPVYDQPQAPSDVHLAQPFESENHGGVESRNEKPIGNLLSHKLQTATSILGNKFGSAHAKVSTAKRKNSHVKEDIVVVVFCASPCRV